MRSQLLLFSCSIKNGENVSKKCSMAADPFHPLSCMDFTHKLRWYNIITDPLTKWDTWNNSTLSINCLATYNINCLASLRSVLFDLFSSIIDSCCQVSTSSDKILFKWHYINLWLQLHLLDTITMRQTDRANLTFTTYPIM